MTGYLVGLDINDGDDALKTTYADFHTAIKAVKDANPKG